MGCIIEVETSSDKVRRKFNKQIRGCIGFDGGIEAGEASRSRQVYVKSGKRLKQTTKIITHSLLK